MSAALPRILLGFSFAMADVAYASHAPALSRQENPNVLLIVLDDVGTDQLHFYDADAQDADSCISYGSPAASCGAGVSKISLDPGCSTELCGRCEYARTPQLDALRQQGILFTNAYAMPFCSPSRACIQTGRYGFRTGIGTVVAPNNDSDIATSAELFLPRLLKCGFGSSCANPTYACAAFGKWHIVSTANDNDCDASPCSPLPQHEEHPVEVGFDLFRGSIDNHRSGFCWTKVEHDATGLATCADMNGAPPASPPFSARYWSPSVVWKDARDWILAQDGPFFAYVAFNVPHNSQVVPPYTQISEATQCELQHMLADDPLDPGEPVHDYLVEADPILANRVKRLIYRADLEAVDTAIGNLIATLDTAGKLADTMIFVVGDNGTPGALIHAPYTGSHAKGSVYQGGIRVPLIVAGPLVNAPGTESDAFVHAVDLFSTIAAVTGASIEKAFENSGTPAVAIDGQSFLPILEGNACPECRTYVFSQVFDVNDVPPVCMDVHQRAIIKTRAADGFTYKYIRKLSIPPSPLPPETCYAGPCTPPLPCVAQSCPLSACAAPRYTEELYRLDDDVNEMRPLRLGFLRPRLEYWVDTELRAQMTALSGY